jgi:hypothetical protein
MHVQKVRNVRIYKILSTLNEWRPPGPANARPHTQRTGLPSARACVAESVRVASEGAPLARAPLCAPPATGPIEIN